MDAQGLGPECRILPCEPLVAIKAVRMEQVLDNLHADEGGPHRDDISSGR